MTAIAKYSLVALDCPDPHSLALFYGAITGWGIERESEDWVRLKSDGGATIAFQLAPDHVPPVWPNADHPQQAHLDFDVTDLQASEARVVALGATKAAVQPGADDGFIVFIDPAGHPFCFVLRE